MMKVCSQVPHAHGTALMVAVLSLTMTVATVVFSLPVGQLFFAPLLFAVHGGAVRMVRSLRARAAGVLSSDQWMVLLGAVAVNCLLYLQLSVLLVLLAAIAAVRVYRWLQGCGRFYLLVLAAMQLLGDAVRQYVLLMLLATVFAVRVYRCLRSCSRSYLVILAAILLLASAAVAARPGNIPSDYTERISEELSTLVVYFSAVMFTTAALTVLADTGLRLPIVLSTWEAAETSKAFMDLMATVCPKLGADTTIQMAGQLRTTATEASLAAARISGVDLHSASFESVMADELAVGLEKEGVSLSRARLAELSEEASSSATERVRPTKEEGIANALYYAVMFPVSLLAAAARDKSGAMYNKLRSKLIKEGRGEWSLNISSEDEFEDWLDKVCDWLVETNQMEAMRRLQSWKRGISLKWNMGGKEYVRLYFGKYHGQFPLSNDAELLFKTQSRAMDKFHSQLSEQLKELDKKKSKKKAFACFKCGDPTHASRNCPHSRVEARRLKKERDEAAEAAEAAAAAAAALADAESD